MRKYLCRAAWYLGDSKDICNAANYARSWKGNTYNFHNKCGWVVITDA